LFDIDQHTLRLARAQSRFSSNEDFLLQRVATDMVDRLGAVQREFETGVALFGRTDTLRMMLIQSGQVKNVLRVEESVFVQPGNPVICAADHIKLGANSADLIIAPMALHWANDLPGALIQLRQILRPDGLLLAALPGPETLRELRASLLAAESEISGGAAMRVDAFTDVRDAGGLLQRAGFALPVVDQDLITVRYDDVFGLINDLRSFGANGQFAQKDTPPLSRDVIKRMAQIYSDQFSDEDGRIRATFQIVSLSGWCPHASQQKPLKPGSAKIRLADALKTTEGKLSN